LAADLVLLVPIAGWAVALAEVPDPVFAEKMLGDGLAIEPTAGVLHAPCDGLVIMTHTARHAVTLRTPGGVEILLHIGLETVGLHGEGFELHVREGEAVQAGQPLISFDLDLVARRARSLVTPIVVTAAAGLRVEALAVDRLVGVGEPLMRLRGDLRQAAPAPAAGGQRLTHDLVIPLVHGLHARPCARIAALAMGFSSEIVLRAADRQANARGAVSMMTLGLRYGDPVTLEACGPDAAPALAALADLIEGGMGEGAAAPPPAVSAPPTSQAPSILAGVTAAPGLAVGRAVRLVLADIAVPELGEGASRETAALAAALAQVRTRIAGSMEMEGSQGSILHAHAMALDDPDLRARAMGLVAEGKSAGRAWRGAIADAVAQLRGLGDPRMAERADDLLDLERQILLAISGQAEPPMVLPEGAILVADDLPPSRLIGLEPGRLAGLCLAHGGPTSHAAILAAAMGVPALVAMGPALAAIADGTLLLLDADAGRLDTAPDADALAMARATLNRRGNSRRVAQGQAAEDCRMADGTRIEVFANLGSLAEARQAVRDGAEGCGLLRTEFLFLERDTAPGEDEQAAQYAAIAEALEGRPLIVRLLDVGGDKTAAYLPIGPEENPALGLRGVRALLRRPELLRTQLRAILRGAPGAAIMVPMVSSPGELAAVRAALDEARHDLGVVAETALGVMIETPAAAMIAGQLAASADFLSVGTNDLTQYALAMDRGNPGVAAGIDALHPAVLRLIGLAVEGGRSHGRWTGVCGGLAADPLAAAILIGLGVTELSVPSAIVAELKALVRPLSLDRCRALAAEALHRPSAEAVRSLARSFIDGAA
jgi:phosphocarrier protein FPr/phosphocarrier protein